MNRSDFLRILGVTTATTVLSGFPRKAEAVHTKTGDVLPGQLKKTQEAVVDKPVTAIVIGAGSRGSTYAGYARQYPGSLTITGVSDIQEERRIHMAEAHQISGKYRFGDWSEVFKVPKFADAVIISTPDSLHYAPCMKALEMGYDVLLEKPIAQTIQQCYDIQQQAKKYNRIVGVCHVLRYAPYFLAMKNAIDSGAIGEIVSVQHFEPIRYHHMAHSYVRGNWHNSKETTPIILAKSCHDLDIIRLMVNRKCEQVSAFGDLMYYKKEHAPEGSSDRCLNCRVEEQCPYSALKIYLRDKRYLYVFDLPEDKFLHEGIILEKLKKTNYGKCVFRCNNDQCDRYVVNLKFESGITAAFSMEAHTSSGGRKTRIMGTKGDITGDMKSFTITDFLTNKQTVWNEDITDLPGYQGHAGGDWGIVKDFVLAVSNHDENYLSSKIEVSVESHIIGFKAEESRLQNKIATI